jgi:SNF2 family DNA or RNA helicase
MDFYYQFETLDPAILGFGSFYSFRNHFCNMGGFQGRQVLSYKNLEELSDLMAPWSFRVTKKQALKDLPPKIYMPNRQTKMTAVQAQAYKDMKKEFAAGHNGQEVEAANVLAQMMRLQQITGGYLTHGEETIIELVEPSKNPKFKEALELIEDGPGQAIVWARFTPEIDGFCRLLDDKKISYRRFDGATPKEDRAQIGRDFLEGKFQVMVSNPQVGGTGQDWYTAETVIYLSNSFNTEDRVQSEDRAHRKGTKNPVAYYDIVVPATEDVRVLKVIKDDVKLSDAIMDALEDWL